jgi:glycosyltransferase involved in cell wall biosynthesis
MRLDNTPEMKMDNITVGILVSTYNWPEALESILLSILRQSHLPDEILIADDGSGNATTAVISKYKRILTIPIKYVWHEDIGFRKSTILNKAMKKSEADYIIQIDGDIILHRNFIEDHVRNAREKSFVQGCRTILDEQKTREVIAKNRFDFSFLSRGIKNRLNAIRLPLFSPLIKSDPEASKNIKACNIAFWRSDYIAVNGYDNHFQGWGWEDDEFAARLIHSGVMKRRLKLAAVCYHLNHGHHSRNDIERNRQLYENTISEKTKTCADGLAQV